VLILGSALMILPVYVAFVASTHDLSRSLTGLRSGRTSLLDIMALLGEGMRLLWAAPIGPMLVNSFIVALAITFGKIAVSILSGFAITYFQFPLRVVAFWIIFRHADAAGRSAPPADL